MRTRNKSFKVATGISLLATALGGCVTVTEQTRGDDARFSSSLPSYDYPAQANNGAIYQQATSQSLFEDYKARRIGDILTVLLAEETNAVKSNSASTSRNTDLELTDPIVFGRPVTDNGVPILNTDVESSASFDGQGDAAQSNLLEGSIAVTVAEVLPNGNLVVQGEKWIRINRGEEFIQLRGIVRPVDISATNTVLSTQVADAELGYGGTGQIARSSTPGWLGRVLGGVLWPF